LPSLFAFSAMAAASQTISKVSKHSPPTLPQSSSSASPYSFSSTADTPIPPLILSQRPKTPEKLERTRFITLRILLQLPHKRIKILLLPNPILQTPLL
jgi:hypothetical protein